MARTAGISEYGAGLARLRELADLACRCCDARRSGFISTMLWLIALVVILQSLGLWLFDPLIQLGTALTNLSFLPWMLLLVALWLLSGRMD